MSSVTKLFDLVRNPLSAEELDSIVNGQEITEELRYSVTPGTVLFDMWWRWFVNGDSQADLTVGIGNRVVPVNRLVGEDVNPKQIGTFATWFPSRSKAIDPEANKEKSNTKQCNSPNHKYIARTFVMYRKEAKLPCGYKECRKVPNWTIIESNAFLINSCDTECRKASEKANAFADRLARSRDDNDRKFWIKDTLGISADGLIEHLTEHQKHLVVPVEPRAIAKWPPEHFLKTFSHIEAFLTQAEQLGLRLIYVLEPEPQNGDLDETIFWLIGEYRYRMAMELFYRKGWLTDRDTIKWLVREDGKRDYVTDTLFPSDKDQTWPGWSKELSDRYGKVDSWTYCAFTSKSSVTPEEIEFAVTAISASNERSIQEAKPSDILKKYNEPALPVESLNHTELKNVITQCIQATLPESGGEAPNGWRILDAVDFLALPITRSKEAFKLRG
ncbi:MAG: hypothetical protein AB2719_16655 [Candidatus Thiodiazotropha sp.]